jgi:Flp pilus assembly protein TadD
MRMLRWPKQERRMADVTTSVRALRGALAQGTADFAAMWGVARAELSWLERLGAALFTSGRFEDARALFAGLMALEPTRARHALHTACALERIERFDEALHDVERALAMGVPSDEPTTEPWADVVVRLSDEERAAGLELRARLIAATTPMWTRAR